MGQDPNVQVQRVPNEVPNGVATAPREPDASETPPADIIEEADGRRTARRRPAGPARGRVAANDDAPSIGALYYALEQKPTGQPYRIAAIASLVWVATAMLLGWAVLAPEYAAAGSIGALLAKPYVLAIFATIVVPVPIFWFLAMLAWRAQELRLMSSAMTEVAVRLAEPDRMAEQQVASLGQSVRRQVGFVDEAVSRALGRAGELEALVHSEVAALERSYGENELRIRSLIEELASERDAIANNGERVSETLKGLGLQISQEIMGASQRATEQMQQISQQIDQQLTDMTQRTAHLTSEQGNTFLAQVNEIYGRIGNDIPVILERLNSEQTRLAGLIQQADQNFNQLHDALATGVNSLETQIGGRTEELRVVLSGGSETIETLLTERTAELSQAIGSYTEQLQIALTGGADEIQDAMATEVARLEAALAQGGDRVQLLLEDNSAKVEAALGEHGQEVETALAQRTEHMQGVLSEYTRVLDATLATRTDALGAQLLHRTTALDTAFDERLRAFDESIVRSTLAIDGAVANRAKALTEAMETHAKELSTTLSTQTNTLDETLMQGIGSLRRTSENITRQSIKAIEGLAGQADLLKNVSENLLQQVSGVTNRFEQQGQSIMRAANSLETANFRVDAALQKRQNDLTNLLEHMQTKTGELDRALRTYSASIEGNLNETETRARQLGEEMARGAETSSRAAVEHLERLKEEAEARARVLGEEIARGAETTSRTAIEHLERLKAEAEARARLFGEEMAKGAETSSRAAIQQLERLKAEAETRARLLSEEIARGAETSSRTALEQLDRLRREAEGRASVLGAEIARVAETSSRTALASLESLKREAEKRASEVGREIAAGAEASSRVAIESLDRFKAEADARASATLDALRARVTNVSSTVNEQLSTLTERFNRTSDELKDRATRAALEIEGSQDRLKRHLDAMPVATEQTSAAMRAAVEEQLTALERIANVAQQAALRRDVTPPADQAATQASTRGAAPVPPQAPPPPRRLLDQVTQSVLQELETRGAPAAQGATPPPPLPPTTVTVPPLQPASPPLPPTTVAAATETARENGWKLGDLLKRASADDTESAAAPSASPPVPISGAPRQASIDMADIARAIDPANAARIWLRLRSGERGFIGSDIYNAQGFKIFDELSRRFRNEPDFRATVNKYLVDFERFVQETERKGGGGTAVESYLVGDTGRVYLLLGHLAGRIG